jgi:hypothetical protein
MAHRRRPRTIVATKWISRMMLGLVMALAVVSFSQAGDKEADPVQPSVASPGASGQCSELVALLAEQEQKNSKEFRQIKRDLAALSQQVAEPGMREIFGGIGYILGIFGVAAYVASRKKANGGGR